MNEEFLKLLKRAKEVQSRMSPEQLVEEREIQRRSFAYGNTHFENEFVSREMIDHAAEELKSATLDNDAK